MVRPALGKWQQTVSELRRLSVEAEHARSRERYQALYMIASGQSNATQWAMQIGRKNQTVMEWVHRYNASGPEALHYQKTGGRPPLFAQSRSPS
jgi:transposase